MEKNIIVIQKYKTVSLTSIGWEERTRLTVEKILFVICFFVLLKLLKPIDTITFVHYLLKVNNLFEN